MVSVLILIRQRNAKSRLSCLLGREERERLIVLMFHSVLSAVGDQRVYVLSPTRLAGDFTWIEDRWGDINNVVAKACRRVDDDLLILPSDIPAIRRNDIVPILSSGEDLVFVPALDGGTNALFSRKGISFTTHFGPQSFSKHVRQARENGFSYSVLPLETFRDIDTEEDLAWFYPRSSGEIREFLGRFLPQRILRTVEGE